MIFKNHSNEVSHYIIKNQGEVFCDAYNFYNMTRTENAYNNLIRLHANLTGNVETVLDDSVKFSLRLDLLNNVGNEYLINKVNHLIHAVMKKGLQFTNGNAQENFTLHNLSVNDICDLINDPTFQSANIIDTFSTWRVTIMN